ncbi:hypothetical protein BKA65DRAFT_591619 [Rhexocercosporidium sp. MPI-PUGE-AT-0058]|nr:hypothetical protein BKA65DRAFT_591619 [Rhexocercosporidium sp. MPI-PUGE-AT-0058]
MSPTPQISDETIVKPSLASPMENPNVTSTKQSAASSGSPISRPQLATGSSSTSNSSSNSSSSTDLTALTASTPTPLSAPAPAHPKYNCHTPQLCPKTGQAIDVLSRHYPKPEQEIDVEEALARGPLPGRYWVAGG